MNAVPNIKFGAQKPLTMLVRHEGNDAELRKAAAKALSLRVGTVSLYYAKRVID